MLLLKYNCCWKRRVQYPYTIFTQTVQSFAFPPFKERIYIVNSFAIIFN